MSDFGKLVDWLSTAHNWWGPDGATHRIVQHLGLTAVSLAIAGVIAVPLGVWLGHIGRGGALAINLSNAARAVPTFAVLVLLAVGPLGLGNTAVVVSLVLFALAPMLANSFVGVDGVDRDVTESARAMGMTGWQVLVKAELPLAMPLLMTGIRIATVQVVATATIAALIGGGGLGRLVVDGFTTQNRGMLLGGAVLVAVLALLLDGLLALAQRSADPLRRRGGGAGGPGGTTGRTSRRSRRNRPEPASRRDRDRTALA
jgi:osmoprotectant transport system permease protein